MCRESDALILTCEIPSGIQGGRTAHDQATMLELRNMLAEMKELLHQQVTCPSVSPVENTQNILIVQKDTAIFQHIVINYRNKQSNNLMMLSPLTSYLDR